MKFKYKKFKNINNSTLSYLINSQSKLCYNSNQVLKYLSTAATQIRFKFEFYTATLQLHGSIMQQLFWLANLILNTHPQAQPCWKNVEIGPKHSKPRRRKQLGENIS